MINVTKEGQVGSLGLMFARRKEAMRRVPARLEGHRCQLALMLWQARADINSCGDRFGPPPQSILNLQEFQSKAVIAK
jgi:hypothetical protein